MSPKAVFMAFAQFAFWLGWLIAAYTFTRSAHNEAIEHHAAHWDATTGEFKWNDEAKP